ncbi:MAG: hypothetical protein JXR07_01830 [Reichenbachiella sp.]
MKNAIAKSILLVLVTLSISNKTKAQSYEFSYEKKELIELKTTVPLSKHPFGDEFAHKLQLLREQYTYVEYNEINQTKSTIVEKPSIYYSVQKANKHLKKSVKKGWKRKEEATVQLTEILDKAINIRYQDTEKLEEVLWKVKDPVEITELYTQEIAMN